MQKFARTVESAFCGVLVTDSGGVNDVRPQEFEPGKDVERVRERGIGLLDRR